MIKRYLQFIKEDLGDFDSLGQRIESLIGDQYIRNIVARYTQDTHPSINLANAIDILEDKTKAEIKQQVDQYLERGIPEREPSIISSIDTTGLLSESIQTQVGAQSQSQSQTEVSPAGKGIFTSFLKALTALGKKESTPVWSECPAEFLLYYGFSDLESEVVKQIFSRFRSLSKYLFLVDYQQNHLSLYFGVTNLGEIEYGIKYQQRFPMGQFKLSPSNLKWLLSTESKSAQSLKKEIVNLNYADFLVLGQIKRDMKEFTPGYSEKSLFPILRDRIFTFGHYGVGRWDNGVLDQGEYENIKTNFTNWLMQKKWSSKVLISVKPQSFWLYFHIKLK